MAKEFPRSLLEVGTFQAWPAGVRVRGGSGLAGPAQTVDWSGGGWWMGKIGGVQMWTPDHHRIWRALMMHAVHSGGEIIMPFIDDPQRPMDDPSLGHDVVRFNDGATFSDGSAFRSGHIHFDLAEPALEGDTTLKIRRVTGRPLLGGEYWSFNHPSAGYRVYCIEDLDAENSSGVREVQFGVPLRTDLAASAEADFENPRLTMKVMSEPSEAFSEMTAPFDAVGGFTFIESFDYLDD